MSYKKILSGVEEVLKAEAEKNLTEYKADFLEMNIGALTSIMRNAEQILASITDPKVKENLTESWLQGKIAITEDYMTTIHDFVKYSPADDDKENMAPASLWENIRKKKLREGKNYKPAKPGDKDRPKKDAWKRAQGEK
jgi:outer membrane PBP1 activator LpoA protein